METGKAARTIMAAAVRGSALLALWLGLTRGENGLAFGLVTVGAATALSMWVLPAMSPAIDGRRVPGFLWHFGRSSLLAGLDVARRAIAPRPDLAPDLIVCQLRLSSRAERVLLADLVTLLPGTLTAGLEGAELTVHALDRRQDVVGQVRALEARIRGLRSRSRR